MKIESTDFPGLMIIEPAIYKDDRGYFFESYNSSTLNLQGINYVFVQDNQAKSSYGVIRGLHYQLAPFAQTKLIRVLKGKIYDAVVDIRKKSPTYKQWFGIELSEENHKQLLIPKGFAHGYSVLSEEAVILYKCDDFYYKKVERGILYNDKLLNIDWKIDKDKCIISAKDKALPDINTAEMNFHFSEE